MYAVINKKRTALLHSFKTMQFFFSNLQYNIVVQNWIFCSFTNSTSLKGNNQEKNIIIRD